MKTEKWVTEFPSLLLNVWIRLFISQGSNIRYSVLQERRNVPINKSCASRVFGSELEEGVREKQGWGEHKGPCHCQFHIPPWDMLYSVSKVMLPQKDYFHSLYTTKKGIEIILPIVPVHKQYAKQESHYNLLLIVQLEAQSV